MSLQLVCAPRCSFQGGQQRRGYLEDGVLGRFEPGREREVLSGSRWTGPHSVAQALGTVRLHRGRGLSDARSREGDGETVSRSSADVVATQDRFPVQAPGRGQWELASEGESGAVPAHVLGQSPSGGECTVTEPQTGQGGAGACLQLASLHVCACSGAQSCPTNPLQCDDL